MAEGYSPGAKVYPTENLGKYSILDMLKYFETHGAMRVSDLHIKVNAPPAYRIDGNLVKLKGPNVTPEIAKQLIYPLMKEHSLQRLQTHYSVDCSYRLGSLQFRINIFRENDGLAAAIRALSLDVPAVEDIGFANDVWKDIITRKHGLVLLTGITGAGKSTTIASLIGRISEKSAHRIMTVEDPIEYIFTQKYSIISQREVGRDVLSFSEGLKEMMREDPDVIFVGEMRDAETIAPYSRLLPRRATGRGKKSAFVRAGVHHQSKARAAQGREGSHRGHGDSEQQLRLRQPDTHGQDRATLLAVADQDAKQTGREDDDDGEAPVHAGQERQGGPPGSPEVGQRPQGVHGLHAAGLAAGAGNDVPPARRAETS